MTEANYTFDEALRLAQEGAPPDERWLTPLLACSDDDAPALYAAADAVRAKAMGPDVYLRALVEFSNHCRRNCRYCGLRRDNLAAARYRLQPADIVATAQEAAGLGYGTVVLQSGEDPWYTTERLAEAIRGIKASTGMAVTLSVGERDPDTYRAWRQAGADRFLLRIETTDPGLFAALHPDDDLEGRKACLCSLRGLGYQLGSGVMVGLPGQTVAMLARDIVWLHELGAEMIGVGPFIPHPDTPLGGEPGGTVEQTLRLVAALRLVFPRAHLPATTAMGTLDPQGRERALQVGANVMMPNVTPTTYRAQYEIYPGKICTGDDARHCRGCVAARIRAIGRTVGQGRGDVYRVACGERPL